jgi:hypothetical protein
VRILAVSALLGLTASCTWTPPEAAVPLPSPVVAVTAPVPIVVPPPPPPPAVVVAEPPAPVVVAAGPMAPARQIEYVPVPDLWRRMLTKPAPAGRLMLNNFSFVPTRVQAIFASGPACAIGDAGAVTEFVLPPNGTRVVPAPPGLDICWRRERIVGEAKRTSPTGPWTPWSRAYTGPGRFLDAVVVTPSPLATVVATVEKAPAPPPPVPLASPKFPPVEK